MEKENGAFENLLKNAKSKASGRDLGRDDKHMSDDYALDEMRDRSHSVSSILTYYSDSYKNKADFQHKYRRILFWFLSVIILACCIGIYKVSVFVVTSKVAVTTGHLVSLITVLISLVVAIIELVHTIVKYCFPTGDDEYILRIVEAVQVNDLEKLKERNRSDEARSTTNADSKGTNTE